MSGGMVGSSAHETKDANRPPLRKFPRFLEPAAPLMSLFGIHREVGMSDIAAHPGASVQPTPLTSSERVNTMAHYHRAEIARMAAGATGSTAPPTGR